MSAAANIIASAEHAYVAHPVVAYALIYIGTILFGNVVVLPALWLSWTGRFGWWGIVLTFVVVLVAHLSGDMLWYWIGRTFRGTGFGRWIRDHLPHGERLQSFLDDRRYKLIALFKIMAAPTIPFLLLAGWYQLEFRRYLRLSGISTLIWFPTVLLIGYGVFTGAVVAGNGSVLITSSVLLSFIIASLIVAHYVVTPRIRRYWK